MFSGFKRVISEFTQDVDGGFSAKRLLLYIFVALFIAITFYVLHYGVSIKEGAKSIYAIPAETLDFLKGIAGMCIDAIKWLATMVLAERAPQAVAAFRGNQTPKVSGD